MELKNGYKQTEIGVIPSDWEVKLLCQLGENIIGLTYSPNNVSEYGHLVLRSSNIQDNKLAFKNNVFVDMDLPNRVIVKENDILICVRNGSKQLIGKCALIDKQTEGSAFGAFMSVYRTEYSSYIFHQFQSNIIHKQIEEVMGATINQLTNKDLATFQIPFPPTKLEQNAISTSLSDADALIYNFEKLIEKKKNIKQGSMQKLLKPKKGWNCISLDKVVWYQEGPGGRNYQFTKSGVKLLNGTNIENGQLFLDKTDRFISEHEAFGFYSHFLADEGDIIIACSGVTINKFDEKVTFVQREHLPLCMNTSTMRFKVINEKIDKNFFFHFLKSDSFKEQIGGKATGSAQLNFGPSHVKNVQISLPNLIEQKEIATILSDIDEEITSLESKLLKNKLIKEGMMHNLLTGKIRLI